MNFFEHQDRARRQSRRLVFAFLLAVLAVVAAVDAVLLLVLGTSSVMEGEAPAGLADLVRTNPSLLAAGTAATLAVIGLASLARIVALKAGGGQVARQLGGVLVESDTQDPRRRQLRNVVEEVAIASGVPVPEIYVLEREPGINAFAAGYSTADAAVAVTRGALEKLDRHELQGVIAHEFSHILNGDMRLNIRLMGALFGILLLALIGRRVLMHAHLGRSSKNKEGAAIVLIAFALVAIGYVGLFFGRWIKAAVSRQREYLADASAVQFTRDPQGIGGALKKIAVYSDGSYLAADSEEISHMLFGDGARMRLFSTHPPLNERIARVDPGFRPGELQELAQKIQRRRQTEAAELQSRERTRAAAAKPGMFDAGGLIDQIGRPDWERMLMAAALAAAVPDNIRRAAHSTEWAPEVLFYTLMSDQPEVREAQLLAVAQSMGSDSEAQVRALLSSGGPPRPEQRLPLMEVAFPALKRRPAAFVGQVLETVTALIEADRRLDVFEFLLSRVIAQHLVEAQRPDRVRVSGSSTLESLDIEARRVLAVLAGRGAGAGGDAAGAYRAGLAAMGLPSPAEAMPEVRDWAAALDSDLPKLDRLKPAAKERLVRGLAAAVLQDGRLSPVELELLRAACDLLHVPLPMLSAGSAG